MNKYIFICLTILYLFFPQHISAESNLISDFNSTDNSWSIKTNAQLGEIIYSDRAYTFTSIPQTLLGSIWIQTSNSNKSATASFTVSKHAEIFAAVDNRIQTLPAWLTDWVKTNQIVEYSLGDTSFVLYKKFVPENSNITVNQSESPETSAIFYFISLLPQYYPDANSDGKIDGLDYIIWLNHYGIAGASGPSKGDFNYDGKTDGMDYIIWLKAYGTSPPAPTAIQSPTQPVKTATIQPSITAATTPTSPPNTTCNVQTGDLFPSLKIPDGIGLAYHPVTGGTDEQYHTAVQAGIKIARIEVRPENTITNDGSHQFSQVKILTDKIRSYGMTPFLILISHAPIGNTSSEWNIITTNGRNKFVEFSKQVALFYKGENMFYEIWNEPDNDKFWPDGSPSPDEYYPLLAEVSRTIKSVDPSAKVIGPSVTSDVRAYFDIPFIEELLKKGMGNHIDALSTHPYTAGDRPERIQGYFSQIKNLLKTYAPNKNIPLVSTEWGYETIINNQNTMQWAARSTIRHVILSLWQEIPLQIYFAAAAGKYSLLNNSIYDAVSTMNRYLNQYAIVRRVTMANMNDQYVFLMTDCENRYALSFWYAKNSWTDSVQSQTITLPLGTGSGTIIDMYGNTRNLTWGSNGLTITASEQPQYLLLTSGNSHQTLP